MSCIKILIKFRKKLAGEFSLILKLIQVFLINDKMHISLLKLYILISLTVAQTAWRRKSYFLACRKQILTSANLERLIQENQEVNRTDNK